MKYGLASLAIAQLLITAVIAQVPGTSARTQGTPIWTVPEIGALPRDSYGLQVREGRDLITATYAYIGPNVPDASKRSRTRRLTALRVQPRQRFASG